MSYRLFILMRTDLASMNAGKAIAQGTHITNIFQKDCQESNEYKEWASDLGFGTAITLDATSNENIDAVLEFLDDSKINEYWNGGTCIDPTYPVRDGKVTHYIPLLTCGYVFIDSDYQAWKDVSTKFNLKRHK